MRFVLSGDCRIYTAGMPTEHARGIEDAVSNDRLINAYFIFCPIRPLVSMQDIEGTRKQA